MFKLFTIIAIAFAASSSVSGLVLPPVEGQPDLVLPDIDAPVFSNISARQSVQTGGFATFYYQGGGYGACGEIHQDSDLIAAISSQRYGNKGNNAPLCGKKVQITNTKNKKTVTVTIKDSCPGCRNSNSIDLSTGAFDRIASEAEGVVPITWKFV